MSIEDTVLADTTKVSPKQDTVMKKLICLAYCRGAQISFYFMRECRKLRFLL